MPPTRKSKRGSFRWFRPRASPSRSTWNPPTFYCRKADMPTKTDRILSYLPGTFQTAPRPPALYAVADTFGNELLLGENSLSAVMLSHWVDFADLNAEAILDLASIAS